MIPEQEYDLVIPGNTPPTKPEVEDKKDAIEVEVEDDIKVTIEDDTPEEDRGREPMPKPIKEELEADELDSYSEQATQRIKQMRKVWHDERREKEQALRVQQAAVEYAEKVKKENEKLRSTLNAGSQEYASMMKHAAEKELDVAKRAYREAYESGDTDAVIEAQQALNIANNKVFQAQNFRVPPLQREQEVVQPQIEQPRQEQVPAAPVQIDPKLSAWQARNTWYGEDDEMTSTALGIHQSIVRNGQIVVGSDEYYEALDNTMRKRYPEKFENTKPKSNQVVAPATRSTGPKRVRLTTSQVALAKKLGITPEQYARELSRMES